MISMSQFMEISWVILLIGLWECSKEKSKVWFKMLFKMREVQLVQL